MDTKCQKGHFLTLLLSLPTEERLEGGSLLLSFEGKNVEWNPSQEEKNDIAPQMDWMAFYTDIHHEIRPVIKGRLVMIALNLIVPEDCQDNFKYFKVPSKIETSSMSLNDKRVLMIFFFFYFNLHQDIVNLIIKMANDYRVIEEIKRLLSDNVYNYYSCLESTAVCILFSHSYIGHKTEECEFNRANLKGSDVAIYTILSQLFHSFVTCCKINAVIDEFESDQGNDDLKGTFCLVVFLLAKVVSLYLCQWID
ncbi:hypothetical protein RFI_31153, partial [Reticulomyxa filosa]